MGFMCSSEGERLQDHWASGHQISSNMHLISSADDVFFRSIHQKMSTM